MIEVFTTFHKEGWHSYGERMVKTFLKYWPQEVKIHLYCENIHPNLQVDRVVEHDIFEVCPSIKPYLEQYNTPKANGIRDDKRDGRYDAIKFCYKVFAQCHMIRNSKADKIIFIDADTLTFGTPPMQELEDLLPNDKLCAYLGRPDNTRLPFSETGFIMYNLQHPNVKEFADTFENLYISGKLFELEYQVDCYTFDFARKEIENKYNVFSNDITGEGGLGKKHPFVNSILGTFMDHLKGNDRKAQGKSSIDDFKDRIKVERTKQVYWK